MKSVKSKVQSNEVETMFADRARAQGFALVRGGWPDFIIVKSGRATFVEVKSSTDKLSEHQRLNFVALESAGIHVKVWWSLTPDRLMPWRRFYAIKGTTAKKPRVPGKPRSLADYVRWELA